MSALPESKRFVIVGAGMHGLSTAWHLAMELERRGQGSGKDIIVLDKTGPGAGATGIACGCVRNLYMTQELHPILRHSVDVWQSDPIRFGFQQVGYISAGEANQQADYESMVASHNACGYRSDLYVGQEAKSFLKSIWPDFNTDRIEVAHFEHPSGYAGTRQAVAGLAEKCAQHGVEILAGVEVTGYDLAGRTIRKLHTNLGDIAAEAVVLSVGAWMGKHWDLLGLSDALECHYPDGGSVTKDMWTYWRLLEGEMYIDRPYRTADDRDPPVLHVELMNTPVINETTGEEMSDHLYVYWKNAAERMESIGLQGGTIPIKIGNAATLDPYGHANDEYQADDWFADYFVSAMGYLMPRFKGHRSKFKDRRNGGIGAFTPDNVPIFDWVLDNAYMVADSNHGFKMIGAGKLVAKVLAGENRVTELEPFAFTRFAGGKTFGSSNSHCPWV
ncbi:MAG: NAD(P)/FAD-dependent oxidoreductase [Kiloniellales bacterium]